MNDPLAELLAEAWMDANCLPETRDVMRNLFASQAEAWAETVRERRLELVRALYPDRDELLRELGGRPRITTVAPDGFAPVAWVFPKESA